MYVHVSGHYVEVVTTAGTAIVLMRFSRNEHRLALHLTGGHKLPVSRSYRAAVRAFMANRDNPRTRVASGTPDP